MGIVMFKFKKQSIPHLFRVAAKSEYVRNAAKLTGGTALAQLIMILASPVLSRLYTPADFGTFALYNSCVTVFLILCTGRYDIGIVSANTRKEAIGLLSLSFVILAFFLLISSFTLVILEDWAITLFNDPQFGRVIYLIPVTVLFLGTYQILSFWFNREKGYNEIAISKVAQNSSNTLLAVIIGFAFSWGTGLIIGNLFGAVVAVLFLITRNKFHLFNIRKDIRKEELKRYASKFSDFPKFSLPTAFLDTFSNQIPIFFIVSFFNETIAGHFSFAYRILSLPLAFIGISLGQVFYQKLTEMYQQNLDSRRFILKMWGMLLIFGIIPFLILFLFGEELFTLIFGEEWDTAGRIASVLSIPLLFIFCSSPTSTAFIVFGIQKYSFVIGIVSVILRPLAFYIGYLKDDIYTGLILWGIFEIILIAAYNIILLKKAKR